MTYMKVVSLPLELSGSVYLVSHDTSNGLKSENCEKLIINIQFPQNLFAYLN